jgi:arginyl-tRNA synthetase
VQYAHARIAAILRRAAEVGVAATAGEAAGEGATRAGGGAALHPSERALVRRLLELPAEVAAAAARRAPHRLTAYALELARDFSAFYRDCRVVGAAEEGGDEAFRLALSRATQAVIARSLDLLGVEAPEAM